MTVVVLTLDQRGSRTGQDRVPSLAARLNDAPALGRPLRRFERTAGDELQGVLADTATTLSRIALLLRDGGWNLGIGVGPAAEPLPRSTRAARGPAFVNAREAVTRAKTSPHHLRVVGADQYRAEQLETVLMLWAALSARRTAAGWEVADLLDAGLTRTQAAERLGVSQPAISQRASVAGVVEVQRARRLAGQLLDGMLARGEDADDHPQHENEGGDG